MADWRVFNGSTRQCFWRLIHPNYTLTKQPGQNNGSEGEHVVGREKISVKRFILQTNPQLKTTTLYQMMFSLRNWNFWLINLLLWKLTLISGMAQAGMGAPTWKFALFIQQIYVMHVILDVGILCSIDDNHVIPPSPTKYCMKVSSSKLDA